MKHLKFLLVICALALLSGCYKFEAKMTITEDKKMDFEVIYAMYNADSLMGGLETEGTETGTLENENENEESATIEGEELPTGLETVETTEEKPLEGDINENVTTIGSEDSLKINCDEIKTSLGEGWTVEEYSDVEYKGCKLKKSYASIDDISGSKEVVVDLTKLGEGSFDDKQLFKKSGNKYSANFKFTIDEESSKQAAQYKDLFKMSYTVSLPTKNTSNNATKVEDDGKTLIWEIAPDKTTEIKYSFKLGEGGCEIPWLYIGIGAGALVLIIIIILIVKGCKKNCKCDCSNCDCAKEEKVEEVAPVVEEPKVEEVTPVVEEPKVEEPINEEVTEQVSENTEENNQ